MGKKRDVKFALVNENAAGIDIGGKEHYVSVGLGDDHVRSFGVFTDDLHEMARWLLKHKVESIAMESTGTYWKAPFLLLQDYGFEVILVNASYTKNVRGRKSDVQDCQWIWQLHRAGLLSASFQPNEFSEQMRTYTRMRSNMIQEASRHVNRLQKALVLMNVHLGVVLSDITGVSGTAIIEAIVNGQRSPVKLAELAHWSVKASQEKIIKALSGHWKDHHLDEVCICWQAYQFTHHQIRQVDERIEALLAQKSCDDGSNDLFYDQGKSGKRIRYQNNDPDFDLATYAYQLSGGIDLYQVPGISHHLVLTMIAEVGFDLSKFADAKKFTSWLGLAPNVKITGGKVISSKTPKNTCRLGAAFRAAANSAGKGKNDPIAHKFRSISHRKGRKAAIVAIARKLATIVYNMLTKQESYRPQDMEHYLEGQRKRQLAKARKLFRKLELSQEELVAIAG